MVLLASCPGEETTSLNIAQRIIIKFVIAEGFRESQPIRKIRCWVAFAAAGQLKMNQNSKIPLTNLFLLESIMRKKQPFLLDQAQVAETESWATAGSASKSEKTNEGTKTVNTSLNYSVDVLEESESRRLVSEESLQICPQHDQNQLLRNLLAFNDHDPENESPESNWERKKSGVQSTGWTQNLTYGDNLSQDNTDYSYELLSLKTKIVEIEELAQQEIVRLKRELEQERNLNRNPGKVGVDVGVNTECDSREEQMRILQESLLGHIALNKGLLHKSMKQSSCQPSSNQNMQNHINKVVL